MFQLLSLLFMPTHPLGLLLGFPAAALWIRYRRGQAGLMGLTAITLVAIAIFPLSRLSRNFLPVLGLFGFTLGIPVACAAAMVAWLVPRRWPFWLIYASGVVAAIIGWWVTLVVVLNVVR